MKLVLAVALALVLGGGTTASARQAGGADRGGTASPQLRYQCGENGDGTAMWCDGTIVCGRWGCVCDPGWIC